ncbi:MAG: DUF308 domain-containing protein [Akkermansiaceae bacterium]|nr:DUF308 domain-containing protein [Akkermansiaceae bacterium]
MDTQERTHNRRGSVLKTEGIILILLGAAAILLPNAFTLAIELLVGAILLVGGLVTMIRGFQLSGISGSAAAVILGLLSAIAGLLFLFNPAGGMISLTIVLAVLFLLQGFAEIAAGSSNAQGSAKGWLLISGIAGVVVALLLLFGLPSTAAWAVGLLVGIKLLFSGISLLTLGSDSKAVTNKWEGKRVET